MLVKVVGSQESKLQSKLPSRIPHPTPSVFIILSPKRGACLHSIIYNTWRQAPCLHSIIYKQARVPATHGCGVYLIYLGS